MSGYERLLVRSDRAQPLLSSPPCCNHHTSAAEATSAAGVVDSGLRFPVGEIGRDRWTAHRSAHSRSSPSNLWCVHTLPRRFIIEYKFVAFAAEAQGDAGVAPGGRRARVQHTALTALACCTRMPPAWLHENFFTCSDRTSHGPC